MKYIDLKKENDIIKEECLKEIENLVEASAFTLGPSVKNFENNFAKFCKSKYCLGVGSGTDALRTALLACGIGRGDEVITTPLTYTSTSLAISHCGATPVFVDVRGDGNIDPDKIEKRISSKTKALLIVHMYGNPCDVDAIKKIAEKHGLKLIDDCSHSHGAKYNGKIVGSLTDMSCFSLYPTKNLGAWGDAGLITSSDEGLLKKAKLYKNYGEVTQYKSDVIGYNSKLDSIQAIVLNAKLKHLNNWNNLRKKAAVFYAKQLANVGDVSIPAFSDGCSYYVFPILTKHRNNLRVHLAKRGIPTFIHYPLPLHLQPCYESLKYKKGDLPVAESYAKTVLSLPFYSMISREDQVRVIEGIKDFFNNKLK